MSKEAKYISYAEQWQCKLCALVNKPPKIVHSKWGQIQMLRRYIHLFYLAMYDSVRRIFVWVYADPIISQASELDVLCCSFSWMLFIPYLLIIKRTQKFCVGDDVRWEHNHLPFREMFDGMRCSSPGIHFTRYKGTFRWVASPLFSLVKHERYPCNCFYFVVCALFIWFRSFFFTFFFFSFARSTRQLCWKIRTSSLFVRGT